MYKSNELLVYSAAMTNGTIVFISAIKFCLHAIGSLLYLGVGVVACLYINSNVLFLGRVHFSLLTNGTMLLHPIYFMYKSNDLLVYSAAMTNGTIVFISAIKYCLHAIGGLLYLGVGVVACLYINSNV